MAIGRSGLVGPLDIEQYIQDLEIIAASSIGKGQKLDSDAVSIARDPCCQGVGYVSF